MLNFKIENGELIIGANLNDLVKCVNDMELDFKIKDTNEFMQELANNLNVSDENGILEIIEEIETNLISALVFQGESLCEIESETYDEEFFEDEINNLIEV